MNRSISLSKSKSIFHDLKFQSHNHHYCTESLSQARPAVVGSVTTQALQLLQSSEDDWTRTDHLRSLLLSDSSSPRLLVNITRRLHSSTQALRFFDYLREASPVPEPFLLSSTFQAVLELASRESDAETKLIDLLKRFKLHKLPLTINAATLLLRCFGRFGMMDESLALFKELDESVKNVHVRNVLIDTLLKSGRMDDALIMLDEMLQPESGCLPNDMTCDIVFSLLLRGKTSGRSLRDEEIVDLMLRFGKCGTFTNSVWLTKLITFLGKNQKTGLASDLVDELMKLGAAIEVAPCNALLTAFGRRGEFVKMNALMKKMKESDIQPDVITFGILINHLCKSRRIDEALTVFKMMTSDPISVEPDVIMYNTLIDGLCKVGRQEEGLAMVENMRSQKGVCTCTPNIVTYNCLIDGFSKAGEIDRALELFDRMKKDGMSPNVVTLNTLITGMCGHGRTSAAVGFFNEMENSGLKGNATTYTILINAFCSVNNISKAFELFDQVLAKGVFPDAIVYYTLISGLTLAGRMDDATSVALKAKEAGFGLDQVCYNVLLGGFCKKNKLEQVYETIKEMEEAGLKPDSVTYNTLISHYSKSGDFTKAHQLIKLMVQNGIQPTVVTYGAVINSYCVNGNVDEAMKLFKEMRSSSKVSPNTVIYNTLIDSLCKINDVDGALLLMDEMKEKRVRQNTITYNAMFKGLKENKLLDKAFELMDSMVEQGCNPDYITMEILTEWLSAVGQIDKLKDFVEGYNVQASTV